MATKEVPKQAAPAPVAEKKVKKEKKQWVKKEKAKKPAVQHTNSWKRRKMQKVMTYLKRHTNQLHHELKSGDLKHLRRCTKKQAEKHAAKVAELKKLPKQSVPKKEKKPKKVYHRHNNKIQVPESVQIRRRIRLHTLVKKLTAQRNERVKAAQQRQELVKRATRYLVEYKKEQQTLVQRRRLARMTGNFYREDDPRLILVIRLKGIMNLTPRTRKILKLLRLPQINNATFVRVNKATLNMLRLVSPYVAYGYPNLATIRMLMYKRGYCRHRGQRIPIVDNKLICHHLGKYGVICMEDLIHEIYTVGKHFKPCNKFMWAFKLSNPRGGFLRKSISYVDGGDSGNREEKINSLVRRML